MVETYFEAGGDPLHLDARQIFRCRRLDSGESLQFARLAIQLRDGEKVYILDNERSLVVELVEGDADLAMLQQGDILVAATHMS